MFNIIAANNMLQVKHQAIRTLAIFIRKNNLRDNREHLMEKLVEDLARAKSYFQRSLFVDVCRTVLDLFSRRFFKNYLMHAVLDMTNDPVCNIRMRVCALLPQLKRTIKLPRDSSLLQQLELCVTTLVADDDADVRAAAESAAEDMETIETTTEHAGNVGQESFFFEDDILDQKKEQEESLMDDEEDQEAESERKREQEEMRNKISKLADRRKLTQKDVSHLLKNKKNTTARPLTTGGKKVGAGGGTAQTRGERASSASSGNSSSSNSNNSSSASLNELSDRGAKLRRKDTERVHSGRASSRRIAPAHLSSRELKGNIAREKVDPLPAIK
jgi:hypothetical protein